MNKRFDISLLKFLEINKLKRNKDKVIADKQADLNFSSLLNLNVVKKVGYMQALIVTTLKQYLLV